MSLVGMCVVDSWLVYSKYTESEEKQQDFYEALPEELIDNKHDQVQSCQSMATDSTDSMGSPKLITADGHLRSGISAHITPTKKKRKKRGGCATSYMLQGRCTVCTMKTTQVCSQCKDEYHVESKKVDPEPWICKPTTYRTCFAMHMADIHGH